MRSLLKCFLLLLLAGCGPLVSRPPPPVLHDLGSVREHKAVAFALRDVEVVAPSWLEGTAMHYRLAYQSATRREVYAFSRWAASPSEMLSVALNRMLDAADAAQQGRGCRLRVEIDEFIQQYDGPDSARALISGRVLLMDARGQRVIARFPVAISQAAASADASGGVAALVRSVDVMGTQVAGWLNALASEDELKDKSNGC